MIAGLPKLRSLYLVILLVVCLGGVAWAEKSEAPHLQPVEPVDLPAVQTGSVSLEGIIEAIERNPIASPAQKTSLLNSLGPVIESGLLAEAEALSMLAVIRWSSLKDLESIDAAIVTVGSIASRILDETLFGDPVAEIARLWAEIVMSNGTHRSIDRAAEHAGLEDSLVDPVLLEMERLIEAGFPAGVVQLAARNALRNGEDPLAALALLEATAGNGFYGRAIVEVMGNPMSRLPQTSEEPAPSIAAHAGSPEPAVRETLATPQIERQATQEAPEPPKAEYGDERPVAEERSIGDRMEEMRDRAGLPARSENPSYQRTVDEVNSRRGRYQDMTSRRESSVNQATDEETKEDPQE